MTCEVQNFIDGMSQTFCKHKEMRKCQMLEILDKVRSCDCRHKKRLNNCRMLKSGRRQPASQGWTLYLVAACFGLLLLMIIYVIHVARRYNHVRAYGSSACGSTLFYSYTDCDVFY
ncbi:uncharacterized protein LOC6730619 [Drosophila simulans]|uniref:GD22885 n=2 Tax=melanogaster subgroup TaxID=32351 RepID=B4Q7K2_DROSI|nr:uncharacterized protein LOC6730619 [Drosophila simulans]XP_033166528.1 uncharacterized protein LOC117145115 [Drosophila mauritiana]EDX03382.1 GD22885 [Drosophila simulans]KMY87550.1 uncharacterized protein Dsimw501_GD22885 [Drosophila simulans]